MGNYNPHIPQILGQEWVPIRDENLEFSQAVNAYETGHAFSTTASRTLATARFYIHEFPEAIYRNQVYTAAVYAKGTEDDAGPIQRVVIPCNNGGITGAGVSLSEATSVAQALLDPGDRPAIFFNSGNGAQNDLSMFFAVNSYSAQLTGKRILAVNFLWSGFKEQDPPAVNVEFSLYMMNNGGNASFRYTPSLSGELGGLFGSTYVTDQVNRIRLGDTAIFFNNDPLTIVDTIPWTYTELQKFEATSGTNRIHMHIRTLAVAGAGPDNFIDYAALEILYCEERRLAFGSRMFNPPGASSFPATASFLYGANAITMRTLAGVTNPVLSAGDYTLTLSQSNVGDNEDVVGHLGPHPILNANRELYAIPPHPAIQLAVPLPLDETAVGKELVLTETHILPQTSLHTSGGPMTEPHVYGRQAVAQVYGTITATQEVLDSGVSPSATYPWVRFYGRRFGDTTVPLLISSTSPTVSGSGMRVRITPDEFDALPLIVDGWKEITLRFPTPPSMGGGFNPQWIFSAAGEAAGSRWEVLGATAPALSGIPGNLFNLVPSPNQLDSATYGAPSSGSTINLGWLSPQVTITTDDTTSDAVLMFAQDMPTITGFSVTGAAQEVVGIGLDCGIDPCCIPTAIAYNQLTWSVPNGILADNFNRTVSNGWGTLPAGQTWDSSGGALSVFSVDGEGKHTFAATATRYNSIVLGSTMTDVDVMVQITPTGSSMAGLEAYVYHRYTDVNNNYHVRINFNADGTVTTRTLRIVGGSVGFIGNTTTAPVEQFGGTPIMVHSQIEGSTIRTKVWDPALGDEPEDWLTTVVDTASSFASGLAGVGSTSTTNLGPVIAYDNYQALPLWLVGSTVELERSDTVETDWKTIMRATNPMTMSFSDFEARVGIETSYRIRAVDPYDFPGDYSDEVTITITAPGVSGGCVDEGHVLIFTSNDRQDGSVNLAYASVWEGRVEEGFSFPEAGFVQLQAMYNRDFFTAFRPQERGGEQFSRTVLVQAAAIAPETLADFTGLRDMAWADVPYVCVRDEDGNRWFSTVLVPAGRVLRDRRLYLAAVNVIEVTDTPSPVDP